MTKTATRKATATDYVQDMGTNVLHLGYWNEAGELKAACNSRFQVYSVATLDEDSQYSKASFQSDMGCTRCFH